jgi:hypothetical protein
MPELAKVYRVIAIDTRGMGQSSRPKDGYDTQTAHDVGMWIAYPLAAQRGQAIEKLVMTQQAATPVIGNGASPAPFVNPNSPNFGSSA